ncbi:MAG: hypothetical protein MJ252_04795 [archaeon]|nr:hypothetical protein [archaeon]
MENLSNFDFSEIIIHRLNDDSLDLYQNVHFQEKTSELLNYYHINRAANEVFPNQKLGKWFDVDHNILSLLNAFSSEFAMSKIKVFALFDQYFLQNKDYVLKLIGSQLQMGNPQIQQQNPPMMPQQIQPQNQQNFQQNFQLNQLNQIQINNFKFALYIEIIKFYFKERTCLLRMIKKMISAYFSKKIPDPNKTFNKYMKMLIENKNIMKNLYEYFLSYTEKPLSGIIYNEKVYQMHKIQILTEKKIILKILNMFSYYGFTLEKKAFEDFLGLFKDNKFIDFTIGQGQSKDLLDRIITMDGQQTVNMLQEKIIKRAVLFILNIFQMDSLIQMTQAKKIDKLLPCFLCDFRSYKSILESDPNNHNPHFTFLKEIIQLLSKLLEATKPNQNEIKTLWDNFRDAQNQNLINNSISEVNFAKILFKYIKESHELSQQNGRSKSYYYYLFLNLFHITHLNMALSGYSFRDKDRNFLSLFPMFFNLDQIKEIFNSNDLLRRGLEDYFDILKRNNNMGIICDFALNLVSDKYDKIQELIDKHIFKDNNFRQSIFYSFQKVNEFIMTYLSSRGPQFNFQDTLQYTKVIDMFIKISSVWPNFEKNFESLAKDQPQDKLFTISSSPVINFGISLFSDALKTLRDISINNGLYQNLGYFVPSCLSMIDLVIPFIMDCLFTQEESIDTLIDTLQKIIQMEQGENKNFIKTSKCIKIVNVLLNFDTIYALCSTANGQKKLEALIQIVISSMDNFSKTNLCYEDSQSTLITQISDCLSNVLNLFINSSSYLPNKIKPYDNRQAQAIQNYMANNYISVSECPLLNCLVDLMNRVYLVPVFGSFFTKILKVVVTSDPYSSKRYKIYNNILGKNPHLNKDVFQRMLHSLFIFMGNILNLVIMSKSNNYSNSYTVSFLQIVKEWDKIFFKESLKAERTSFDDRNEDFYLNFVMLLFTYLNFENENDLMFLNLNPEDHRNYFSPERKVFNNFDESSDYSVSSLTLGLIKKVMVIYELQDRLDNPQKDPLISQNKLNDEIILLKKIWNFSHENLRMDYLIKEKILNLCYSSPYVVKISLLDFFSVCSIYQPNFTNNILGGKLVNGGQSFFEIIPLKINELANAQRKEEAFELSEHYIILLGKILSRHKLYQETLFRNIIEEYASADRNNSTRLVYILDIVQRAMDANYILSVYEDFKKFVVGRQINIPWDKVLEFNKKIKSVCRHLCYFKNISDVFSRLLWLTEIQNGKVNPGIKPFFKNQIELFIRRDVPALLKLNDCLIRDDVYDQIQRINSLGVNGLNVERDLADLNITMNSSIFKYGINYYVGIKDAFLSFGNKDLYNGDNCLSKYIIFGWCYSLFHSKYLMITQLAYFLMFSTSIGPYGFVAGNHLLSYEEGLPDLNDLTKDEAENKYNLPQIYETEYIKGSRLSFDIFREMFNKKTDEIINFFFKEFLSNLIVNAKEFLYLQGNISICDNYGKETSSDRYMCCKFININIHLANIILANISSMMNRNPNLNLPFLGNYFPLIHKYIKSMDLERLYFSEKGKSNESYSIIISDQIHFLGTILNFLQFSNADLSELIKYINDLLSWMINLFNMKEYLGFTMLTPFVFCSYLRLPFLNTQIGQQNNYFLVNRDSLKSFITALDKRENFLTPFLILLITFFENFGYKTIPLLISSQTIDLIASKQPRNMSEYTSNERNKGHLKWCLTLKFCSELLRAINELPIEEKKRNQPYYSSVMKMLHDCQNRSIKLIESFSLNDISNNKISLTMATLEEIDALTDLLQELKDAKEDIFSQADERKILIFCEYCLAYLSRCLIIFKKYSFKYDFSVCSTIEKKMEKIKLKSNQQARRDNLMFNQNNPFFDESEYLDNLFNFHIGQLLNRIYFRISCFALRVSQSNEGYFFNQIQTLLNTSRIQGNVLLDISENIYDAINYGFSYLNFINSNMEKYLLMLNQKKMFFDNVSTSINNEFYSNYFPKEDIDSIAYDHLMAICFYAKIFASLSVFLKTNRSYGDNSYLGGIERKFLSLMDQMKNPNGYWNEINNKLTDEETKKLLNQDLSGILQKAVDKLKNAQM